MSPGLSARLGLGLALGAVLGLASLGAPACVLPNPDHCFHKAADTNAWCAEQDPERPYCSPCASEHQGCVDEEPSADACPGYTAPETEETGLEETGSDETGLEETGSDETGSDESGR